MVAPEGRALVVGACIAAGTATYFLGLAWSTPLWVVFLALLMLFRDPKRKVPASPLAIVSPIDGKVISVEKGRDEWLDREALVIGVEFLEPGVSPLRSPSEGKVMDFWTNLGSTDAPARSPTEYTMWVRTDECDDIVFSVTTRRFSRFKADIAPGERVGQGRRNGFIFFGKRVDVLAPASALPQVGCGEAVLAGSAVLALLNRESAE